MVSNNQNLPWYEDDAFWLQFAPYMFSKERWSRAPEEAEQAAGLLGIHPPAAVLDACCGVGRHVIELSRMGYSVTGFDRTRAYLEAAAETAKSENLSIDFIRGGIESYEFSPQFDGIINLFSSFGYFSSREMDLIALKNLRRALNPEGALLIDVMGKEIADRELPPTEWFEEEGKFILIQRGIDQDWEYITNRWCVIDGIGGKKADYTFSIRLYSAAEFRALFEEAGFSSVRFYGGMEGNCYDRYAKRLVAVGKK